MAQERLAAKVFFFLKNRTFDYLFFSSCHVTTYCPSFWADAGSDTGLDCLLHMSRNSWTSIFKSSKSCVCTFCHAPSFLRRLSEVSQHCQGKWGRLMTLDRHKWNANGLWNHIKALTGVSDAKNKSLIWLSQYHLQALFLFILMSRDIYVEWQRGQEEGKDGGWRGVTDW